MENFAILVCKREDNYIIIYEGEYEKLLSIYERIKSNYSELKVVQLDKDEYTSKKGDISELNKLLETKF